MKRAIHLDFHTMPGIYDFGRDWNAKEFAARLKKSHVGSVTVFAQCNLGFCYYPTKVGVKYPHMNFDLFGEMVEACHAEGLNVVAYISTGLNHEQSRRHPEWCQVNKEGYIICGDRTENFFRTVCYNTGFKEHVYEIVKEVLKYNPDGMFCDSVVARPCYCSACSEKMVQEGIDITDDKAVEAFGERSTLEFAKGLKALLPEGVTIKFNGIGGSDINTHGEIECLPSAIWGYDYISTTAAYIRNVFEDTAYMTGRFQTDWGDFGGIKSKESLEYDFYDSLYNGIQFAVGDHMHPRCKLQDEVYDIIGDLFARMEEYEKWVDDAKYIHEIGILFNGGCLADAPSHKGIVRILGELKYNYDIIDENMDFTQYKLLILPDELCITPFVEKKIHDFVKSGKPVISTGSAGLIDGKWLDEWNSVFDYVGLDTTKTSYYSYNGTGTELASYSEGVFIKAKEGAEVICDYIKPYFDRHWDGLHGYYYTPPEKSEGYAAVVKKDNICHISFKICRTYYEYAYVRHKELFKKVLEIMLPERLIETEGLPSYSRVSLTGTDKYSLLHTKITHPDPRGASNIIEDHSYLPAGRIVKVKGLYQNVQTLPDMDKVEFECENGYTKIILPEIMGYKMFLLEK